MPERSEGFKLVLEMIRKQVDDTHERVMDIVEQTAHLDEAQKEHTRRVSALEHDVRKLRELMRRAGLEESARNGVLRHWKWLVPVLLSLAALLDRVRDWSYALFHKG